MKIFPKIIKPVQKILTSLKTEEEVAEDITYQRYDSQAVVDGKPVNSYTEFEITALRLRHTEDSAKALGGSESIIQQGDVLYLIDARDFPEATSLKDYIVTSIDKIENIKYINNVYDLLHVVTVESN